jgi:Tat protein translocase TatB subunit
MFGIGSWELIVILVLALIVLGPKKLPEVAKSLGKGLAHLRHSLEDVKDEIGLDEVKTEILKAKDDIGFDEIKAEIVSQTGFDDLRHSLDVRGDIRRAIADLDAPPGSKEENPKDENPKDDGGGKQSV